jgi:hypothetical protein
MCVHTHIIQRVTKYIALKSVVVRYWLVVKNIHYDKINYIKENISERSQLIEDDARCYPC